MMDTRPQSATGADDQTPLQQLSDFSLVAGGPLFRLWRRTRLSGGDLELPQRRVLALVVLIWVPLLVLSMIDGRAWGNGLTLPFLQDIETHLRLLIAVPLLVVAEIVVHRSLPPIVRQFVDNGLIRTRRVRSSMPPLPPRCGCAIPSWSSCCWSCSFTPWECRCSGATSSRST
jgi:hypothetical protein